MGFSSVDSFIIAFSTRDPRSGGIAARRCFILGHPGQSTVVARPATTFSQILFSNRPMGFVC